jgi:serine/threonine protein kinase
MLGEGGMGAVYLAEDLTLSRRVAIKFMRRSLLAQTASAEMRESLEQRFIREARSAAAINHPNLAQIYEANFETENWFIAMEFIDGQQLDDLLTEGKLYSVADIVSITRQTVSGLDFAWQNYKIIHRDIKPQNIMLTKDNLVKIVDLGLAKPMVSEEDDYELPELTCAGTPLGTPQYMAPEQATGAADMDFRADLFALGATIYEMLTGKKAFSGNTAPMIYMSQIQKKYEPIRELRDNIPERLADLIDAMMEPKPEDRIGSYAEVLTWLGEIPLDEVSEQSGVFQSYYEASPTVATMVASRAGGPDQSVFYPTDKLIRDRYRILKPIGKGRAGMVYHCLDTQLGVECAVKSLFPGREFPAQDMPRIKENFQRLLNMTHPNLVQIRDLQTEDDTGELFIVTEMLSGQNLREYSHNMVTEHGTLSVEMVAPVLQGVAEALDSVSSAFKVIHHDLKPESIFLIENNTKVKLLDYGITAPDPEEDVQVPADELHKFPIATPDYMAPELWRREQGSLSADLYSFGVIVYEMLSRRLPFWLKDPLPDEPAAAESDDEKADDKKKTEPSHEDQLQRLFGRVQSEEPTPIETLGRSENAALLRALEKAGGERYPTCTDFMRALSGRGKSKGIIFAVAALLVLGLIGGAFAMKKKEAPAPVPGITQTGTPSAVDPGTTGAGTVEAGGPAGTDPLALDPEAAAAQAERDAKAAAAKRRLDQLKRDEELRQFRKTAEAAKAEYAKRRVELVDEAGVAEQLASVDDIAKPAVDAYVAEDYEAAINHYQTAIDELKKIEDALKQAERDKLMAVKREAEHHLEMYEEERLALMKDPQAVPFLDAPKELADKGKVLLEQEAFRDSLDSFKSAREALQSVRERVADLAKRQVLEQKDQAERLKSQYLDLRVKLAKKPEAKRLLARPDELATAAKEMLKNEEWVKAARQYQVAIEACHDVEGQLQKVLKRRAADLQTECNRQFNKIADLGKLSSALAEKVVRVEVSLGSGREEVRREEFENAIAHFEAAAAIMSEIEQISKDKFEAIVGKDFTVPGVGMEFVWIEAMKAWVARYEVTNREYRLFKPKHDSKKVEGFSLNEDHQPVLWLNYYNAVAYCQWLNVTQAKAAKLPTGYSFRLPSTAEWKIFAQCGTQREFPWGPDWPPPYGNFGNQEMFPGQWRLDGYSKDKYPVSCPVKESGKNEWGLYGVAGNVWEWTTSEKADRRAVLGGGWTECTQKTLKIDVEAYAPANDLYDNIGFRVIIAPDPE